MPTEFNESIFVIDYQNEHVYMRPLSEASAVKFTAPAGKTCDWFPRKAGEAEVVERMTAPRTTVSSAPAEVVDASRGATGWS